ncbi:MAG: hypothetical protein FRX48_06037 [Lasallia pustulata]|uniref:Uncharacterized protein n=1 Tax=Lasallia pustulata TaxID=136370 RepID=A0A5M8PM94_9LECA|nr:MAG: hypothetical protein FRX48_06037 [Lasallia pustulata]
MLSAVLHSLTLKALSTLPLSSVTKTLICESIFQFYLLILYHSYSFIFIYGFNNGTPHPSPFISILSYQPLLYIYCVSDRLLDPSLLHGVLTKPASHSMRTMLSYPFATAISMAFFPDFLILDKIEPLIEYESDHGGLSGYFQWSETYVIVNHFEIEVLSAMFEQN